MPESGELPIPRPYGALAPFQPSQLGSNMRHIRKPNPQPVDIWKHQFFPLFPIAQCTLICGLKAKCVGMYSHRCVQQFIRLPTKSCSSSFCYLSIVSFLCIMKENETVNMVKKSSYSAGCLEAMVWTCRQTTFHHCTKDCAISNHFTSLCPHGSETDFSLQRQAHHMCEVKHQSNFFPKHWSCHGQLSYDTIVPK